MPFDFTTVVDDAITAYAPEQQTRLRRVVPTLLALMQRWPGGRAGEFVLAAATPNNGWLLSVSGWPDIEDVQFTKAEIAAALTVAIEDTTTCRADVILGASAALIGPEGVALQRSEDERFAAMGATVLTTVLIEYDGASFATLVAPIPMAPATVH